MTHEAHDKSPNAEPGRNTDTPTVPTAPPGFILSGKTRYRIAAVEVYGPGESGTRIKFASLNKFVDAPETPEEIDALILAATAPAITPEMIEAADDALVDIRDLDLVHPFQYKPILALIAAARVSVNG